MQPMLMLLPINGGVHIQHKFAMYTNILFVYK